MFHIKKRTEQKTSINYLDCHYALFVIAIIIILVNGSNQDEIVGTTTTTQTVPSIILSLPQTISSTQFSAPIALKSTTTTTQAPSTSTSSTTTTTTTTIKMTEHSEITSTSTIIQLKSIDSPSATISTSATIPTSAPTSPQPLPTSSTPSPPPSPPPVEMPLCFYTQPEECFYNINDINPIEFPEQPFCKCRIHPIIPKSLICCNVTDIQHITTCKLPPPSKDNKNSNSNWLNIHIRNATLQELDISHQFWKLLKSFAVTDGHIKRITNEFTKFSMTKCLNLSNNELIEIYPRAFTNLTQLQVIDISHNKLTRIPNLSVQTNLTVDIRGNNGMLCDSVRETIERSTLKFIDPDTSFCLQNQTFNWFNTTDSVPVRQLERMKQLNSECPSIPGYGNCTCLAEKMNYEETEDGQQHLILAAKVDCSGLGLIELPDKLPESTHTLNVSNNNISSIGNHFHENPTYANIVRFYADNNQISSMYELEGTIFIRHFETFHLRRNNIDRIPEYLLSNALDDDPFGRFLYLGGNRLTCDCNSAKVLKIWLIARHHIIPDYNQILCRNLPQKVVDLMEIKLCQSPHDWTDYIYYLIAAEIILLVILITKVSYDYWVFKTAGYLPWPASEMPKLPCDWLCET